MKQESKTRARTNLKGFFYIALYENVLCLSVYAYSLTHTQHPWSHPSHIHPSRGCRTIPDKYTLSLLRGGQVKHPLPSWLHLLFLPNRTPQISVPRRHLSPNRLHHYYDLIPPKKNNYIKESCHSECVLGINQTQGEKWRFKEKNRQVATNIKYFWSCGLFPLP